MRFLFRVLLLIVGALVLAMGAMFLASEMSGEVVRMRSFDGEGRGHETRLWIVDHDGHSYLRGRPESAWYGRVAAVPEIELERDGEFQRYRAVPSERMRGPINGLMLEKYGMGEQMIALFRNMDEVMPLRLDPPRP